MRFLEISGNFQIFHKQVWEYNDESLKMKKGKILVIRGIIKFKIELHKLYREFEIKIEIHPLPSPQNGRGMFYV